MVFTALVDEDLIYVPLQGVLVEVKLVSQPWSNPVATAYTDMDGKAYLEVLHMQFQDIRFSKTGYVSYGVNNAYLSNYGSTLVHLVKEAEPPPDGEEPPPDGDEPPPPPPPEPPSNRRFIPLIAICGTVLSTVLALVMVNRGEQGAEE